METGAWQAVVHEATKESDMETKQPCVFIHIHLSFSISFSLSLYVKVKSLSHVRLFATPWTAAYQAPPSMGFSGQECWNGLPFPHSYVYMYKSSNMDN